MSSDGPLPLPNEPHHGRGWAMLLHGSQLFTFVVPFAGTIAPFMTWRLKRSTVPEIAAHGMVVADWIYSYLIYLILGFLISGIIVGPLLCLFVIACGLIFPVVGLVKAGRGKVWRYPLSLPIMQWLGVTETDCPTATTAVAPRLFDRLRLPLFSAALSVVFGVSPLVPSLIASVVAAWNGCRLHEGFANPCVVCGVECGDILYSMGICFLWAFATLPFGLITLIASLLWLLLELFVTGQQRRDPTGAVTDVFADIAAHPARDPR